MIILKNFLLKIVDKINNISFDFITVHIINLIISLNKTIDR